MEWRPIDTIPEYISWVEIKYANGKTAISPWPPAEITEAQQRQLAKEGHWPDNKNWKPVEWRIPDEPEPRIGKPKAF